jgi:hypothetical protein
VVTYVAISESCRSFDGTKAQAPPKLWSYLLKKANSSNPESSVQLVQICAVPSDDSPVQASSGVRMSAARLVFSSHTSLNTACVQVKHVESFAKIAQQVLLRRGQPKS